MKWIFLILPLLYFLPLHLHSAEPPTLESHRVSDSKYFASGSKKILVGVSSYTDLGNELYIGGIYSNSRWQGHSEKIIAQISRIEYRIAAERWSKQQFITHLWNWSSFSNADFVNTQESAQIGELASKLKSALYKGDSITISETDDEKTQIKLNNFLLLETSSNRLFLSIRNSWLGDQVPQHTFFDSLMAGVIGENSTITKRYSRLNPDRQRHQQIALWTPKKNTKIGAMAAKAEPGISSQKIALLTLSEKNAVKEQHVAATPAQSITEHKSPIVTKNISDPGGGSESLATNIIDVDQGENNTQLKEREKAEADWNQHVSIARRKLYSKLKYPRLAQRRKIEGYVILTIELGSDGKIGRVELEKKSGFKGLDKAAMAAGLASNPWPVPPASIAPFFADSEGNYKIGVPISFKLNKS